MDATTRRFAIWAALGLFFCGVSAALAAVTVTPASGGTGISADKAANATSPAYTTLGNIVIAENANTDFAPNQTNRTLILTAPSGWQFNAGVGSVSFTKNRDITAASVVVTASAATVTLSTDSNANRSDTLTISGIQVRATDGAAIPSSGSILRTVANPGTAVISGIINGTTNFGSLSQTVGNAAKLAFTTQPGGAVYGSALAPQPVVKSEDQFGSLSTTGLGTSEVVTLSLALGTGALTGTSTADIGTSAGNGVGTFIGLIVSSAGTDKSLSASALGLASATSSAFTVSKADQTISFGTLPDKSLGDADFAVNATASSGLTVSFASLTAGVCTVSATTVHLVAAGTCTIRASQAGDSNYNAAPNVSQSFNVAPVATKFVIMPPAGGATVDTPVTVTVRAEKPDGSVDTNYQQDVTLHTTGSATGAGLVDIVNGIGALSISDTVAENVTLSLTDSQSTGLDVSSTQPLAFASGATAQFVISHAASLVAGQRAAYVITREDQYGNAVTAGASTAYLYSSSTGVDKRFYDAASGGSAITSVVMPDGQSSATFWYYDEKAGDWFITVSDNPTGPDSSGIADASDAITVQPAAVAKFLLNDPGDMTAGTRLGYVVSREDRFGNAVTAGVTLAYLYSSSTGTTTKFYDAASGGEPITFATINDGGSSGGFWYYEDTPGTWTVRVSDSSVAPDGAVGVADAEDAVIVSSLPIVATRFVILPVATTEVNVPAAVTIQAQDGSGNVDTTYHGGVTLVLGGSATGGGLVDIENGVGTATISDATAETVELSLADTEHTGMDVSSTRQAVFSAVPVAPAPPFGGAGALPGPAVRARAGIYIFGRAFPGASVSVLAAAGNGTSVAAAATASESGSFDTFLSGVAAGAGAYGIVCTDALGRTTQTKVLNANYAGMLLRLDAGLFSPTLGLIHPAVMKGGLVGFTGTAAPGYRVQAQVDGKTVASAVAATDGSYKILYSTRSLALGSHAARVRQAPRSGAWSEYAPQKIFTVSSLFTPQTDFNQDGVVNVLDWSVFLSRWKSPVQAVRAPDDLNGDGKVDVTDLSIFIRTMKK